MGEGNNAYLGHKMMLVQTSKTDPPNGIEVIDFTGPLLPFILISPIPHKGNKTRADCS